MTCNPARRASPASRARALAQAWPVIVRRACKKYGYRSIPYLCVFEATKKGEPHLHILCRVKWIDQAWLSRQMRDLTGAPIVDIRKVRSVKQAANYISKYIGKAPHRFATCKRYWCTRSYKFEDTAEPDDPGGWIDRWDIVNRRLPELRRLWARLGYDVAMEGHMLVAAMEPPPGRLEGAA